MHWRNLMDVNHGWTMFLLVSFPTVLLRVVLGFRPVKLPLTILGLLRLRPFYPLYEKKISNSAIWYGVFHISERNSLVSSCEICFPKKRRKKQKVKCDFVEHSFATRTVLWLLMVESLLGVPLCNNDVCRCY